MKSDQNEVKVDHNEMAVLEFLIGALGQIAKHQDKVGNIDHVEIVEVEAGNRPTKNRAKYYKVTGYFAIQEANPYLVSFQADVFLWWHKVYATLAAHLIWGSSHHYRAVMDSCSFEGNPIKVWPDNTADKSLKVDSLDKSGLCLIRDFSMIRQNEKAYLPMRVGFLLTDGDRFEGSFNNYGIEAIIVDIGWNTIAPKVDEIVAIWTTPPIVRV